MRAHESTETKRRRERRHPLMNDVWSSHVLRWSCVQAAATGTDCMEDLLPMSSSPPQEACSASPTTPYKVSACRVWTALAKATYFILPGFSPSGLCCSLFSTLRRAIRARQSRRGRRGNALEPEDLISGVLRVRRPSDLGACIVKRKKYRQV